MKADILIKNGRVIDTYFNTDDVHDIAVKDGYICDAADVTESKYIVDATDCIVTAGLIDFHAHIFFHGSDLAVCPDSYCLPTGVTTIVDAGSSGCANYHAFRSMTSFSQIRQYAFLHVNPAGIPTIAYHEEHNPAYYKEDKMLELFRQYPDQLLGVKVRISQDIVKDLKLLPLISGLEIAEKAGLPLVCHVTDAPVPSNELVSYFRKGDIFTHIYHGVGYTLLGEDGHVMPEFFQARERGVIFDAANGKSHFSSRIARAAIRDGFLPDIISTDATVNNAWLPGSAFSLPYTMSRYLALGLNLNQVIQRVTTNPADLLHQKHELGSLAVGTCADIAIHRLINKETHFSDRFGDAFTGEQLLKTEMTIRRGNVLFRQIDF